MAFLLRRPAMPGAATERKIRGRRSRPRTLTIGMGEERELLPLLPVALAVTTAIATMVVILPTAMAATIVAATVILIISL